MLSRILRSNTRSYLRWKHLLMFKQLLEQHHVQQLASTLNCIIHATSRLNSLLLNAILKNWVMNYGPIYYELGIIPLYLIFQMQGFLKIHNCKAKKPKQKFFCHAMFVSFELVNLRITTFLVPREVNKECSVDLKFKLLNFSFHDCSNGVIVKNARVEKNADSYLILNDITIFECSLNGFAVADSSHVQISKLAKDADTVTPVDYAFEVLLDHVKLPSNDSQKLNCQSLILLSQGSLVDISYFILVVFDPGGYDTITCLNKEAYQVEDGMKLLYVRQLLLKALRGAIFSCSYNAKIYIKMASFNGVTEMVLDHLCSVHLRDISLNLHFEKDSNGYWGWFASNLSFCGVTTVDYMNCIPLWKPMSSVTWAVDDNTFPGLADGVEDLHDLELNPQGKLAVTIIRATNLKSQEIIGKVDPYVVLHIRPLFKFKTRTIDNVNPVWDEICELSTEEKETQSLILEAYDGDIGQDDRIGVTKLPLNELEAETQQELELRLMPKFDMLKVAPCIYGRDIAIWCICLGKFYAALAHKQVTCSMQPVCTSLKQPIHLDYCHWHWHFSRCSTVQATTTY